MNNTRPSAIPIKFSITAARPRLRASVKLAVLLQRCAYKKLMYMCTYYTYVCIYMVYMYMYVHVWYLLIERGSLLGPEGAVEWGWGTHTTVLEDQWRARGRCGQDCLLGHDARGRSNITGWYKFFILTWWLLMMTFLGVALSMWPSFGLDSLLFSSVCPSHHCLETESLSEGGGAFG